MRKFALHSRTRHRGDDREEPRVAWYRYCDAVTCQAAAHQLVAPAGGGQTSASSDTKCHRRRVSRHYSDQCGSVHHQSGSVHDILHGGCLLHSTSTPPLIWDNSTSVIFRTVSVRRNSLILSCLFFFILYLIVINDLQRKLMRHLEL
jgi:hypothetical protein